MFGAAVYHSPPNVVVLFGVCYCKLHCLPDVHCIVYYVFVSIHYTLFFHIPFIVLFSLSLSLSLFNSFLVTLNAYSIYILISLPYHTDSNTVLKVFSFPKSLVDY